MRVREVDRGGAWRSRGRCATGSPGSCAWGAPPGAIRADLVAEDAAQPPAAETIYRALYAGTLDVKASEAAACQWPVGSAQWRTVELPTGGQQNCPFVANRFARGSVGQWRHPLSGGGLGEADAVAGGHDDVGVVQEPATNPPTTPRPQPASDHRTLPETQPDPSQRVSYTSVSNGPTEAINNLVIRVKRAAFGFRRFAHYRIRACSTPANPTGRSPPPSLPANIRSATKLEGPV